MTRDDWRELGFWCCASGAILAAMLLCFAISDLVVELVEMLG